MKKSIVLVVLILFTSTFSFSQRRRTPTTVKWFSLAAKAGVGNSFFINSDHLSDVNVEPNMFSLSYTYGGRFTFTYGDYLGFGTDFLFSGYNQKYNIRNGDIVYDKDIHLKTFDLVPFFRYTAATSAYVELGAKISNIKSVSEENSITENFNLLTTDMLEPKFTGAILGFGLALARTERVEVNLGARISYAFTDLSPNHNITDDGFYVPDYTMSASTNPFSIQALFEVNYFFAFWGDASCNRGRLSFFQ